MKLTKVNNEFRYTQ